MKRIPAIFIAITAVVSGLAPALLHGADYGNNPRVLTGAISPGLPAIPVPNAAGPAMSAAQPGGAAVSSPLITGKQKEWTVMFFMNAKQTGREDLSENLLRNVRQMETVGSSGKLNIVVEIGQLGWLDDDGYWAGSKRIFVVKNPGQDESKTASLTLEINKDADMGDWKQLGNFVLWAKRKFPAKHYALVIANHGTGWKSRSRTKQLTDKPDFKLAGISYDFQTGNHITTVEMGAALAKAGRVDVVMSDACLMQDVAVDYQIAGFAGFIVGSQESEPMTGYEYSSVLKKLADSPSTSPEDFARHMVSAYISFYQANEGAYLDSVDRVTQSAVNTAALPGLGRLLDGFARAALKSGDMEALKAARSKALSFVAQVDKDTYDEDSRDLVDFMAIAAKTAKDPLVISAAGEINKYIAQRLVIANGTTGDSADKAHGISVYIPVAEYDTSFDAVKLAKTTVWGRFCRAMAAKSAVEAAQ
jgi:hypothetical protein